MFQLFSFILMSVKFYSHPDNYLNTLIEKLSFRSILCYSWLIILNFKVYRDVNFHISFYFTIFKTDGLIQVLFCYWRVNSTAQHNFLKLSL